ncbi:MAG: hypothetical protein ORN23_03725 [Chthoniobacterales bacterium]|jgi:hypothetical protein|nr:hypothetical protein [Chthoniobacterales bacterium]
MSAIHHTCQLSAVTAVALLGLPVAAVIAQNVNASSGGSSDALREKLILSEASIKGLTESLAIANGESELFKRRSEELNERIEALGIAPADKELENLRTRLLAAVRDMRLLQKKNDASRDQLSAMTESVMELLKSSEGIDPKARLKVEEVLRSSSAFLNRQKDLIATSGADLTSGTVVDVKPDLSLVVANLGSRQGVKTGMPFQVWRGTRQVASVRVVDVRDAISGAIVQNIVNPAESVRSGDTLRIDTTR